jgi:arylsulfatase A-like enzyme
LPLPSESLIIDYLSMPLSFRKTCVSSPKIRLLLYYFAFGLLVAMLFAGRFILTHRIMESRLLLRGMLADLIMALGLVLLARLLHGLHLSVAAVVLLLLLTLHVANMEMAAAMNTFIHLSDLHYSLDGRFLRGSLLHPTFPGYALTVLASAMFYLGVMHWTGKDRPMRWKYLLPGVLGAVLGVHLLSAGTEQWESANLLWLSLSRSPAGAVGAGGRGPMPASGEKLTALERAAGREAGQPYFRKAAQARRNVLIVVLEGIPGVYLRQVQEATGVKNAILMSALSRIAERSLVVPNFLTHNRQTIRGLYSLLSGDYCKLSLDTPKSYEYVSLPPSDRDPCLPEILAAEGYATAYLQAAELAYMSKDRFMSAAGFRQVLGREYFRYQHVPFGWGPDDRAFFEQAADFIVDLDRQAVPWLVTLLTVGTHHPGAVPDEFAAAFSSRREASVAYLDQALAEFYQRLEESGILDDTLLFFTSDESHGVPGQPFGRFWGLAVAHAPESRGTVNPGVFGLIDVPRSILDYLGLPGPAGGRATRSLFRKFETERPMLFESYLSERKGLASRLLDDGQVEVLQSANGELFSAAYTKLLISGQEGLELAELIRSGQAAAEAPLFGHLAEREYLLLQEDEFVIGPAAAKVLSTGQYLDIPAGTSVTVSLETAVAPQAAGDAGIRLVLRLMKEGEKMPLPEVAIPILKGGDALRLSFSFFSVERLDRIWALLQAMPASEAGSSPTAQLTVRRFAVKMIARQDPHDFRVDRLQVD